MELQLQQVQGAAQEQGCYDVRPPCNPAKPTGMGLDNAYLVNPQTGRAWGVEPYPGGLPALYADGVVGLVLREFNAVRPIPLPAGWHPQDVVIVSEK